MSRPKRLRLSWKVDECKALPSVPTRLSAMRMTGHVISHSPYRSHGAMVPFVRGATLLHFSAQRKRFLWDRGCI